MSVLTEPPPPQTEPKIKEVEGWRVQTQCDSRGVMGGRDNGVVVAWALQWGSSGPAQARVWPAGQL